MMQADDLKTFHVLIPNEVDFLYIPINHEGNQWLLCRIDFSKKVILLLNSLSNDDVNQQYLMSLQKYVSYVEKSIHEMKTTRRKIRNAEKWKGNWTSKDDSMNSPQQSNTNDSGIFTILNMCLLISGVKVTCKSYSHTQIIHQKTRERLAKIIFDFTDWEKLHNLFIEQEKTSELDSKWQDFIGVMFYQRYYGSNFK
jgi:Ulp1 family protease